MKTVYRFIPYSTPSAREKRAILKYSMHVYEEEHTDVDEKLYDLKNILIKYVHGDSLNAVYQEVIFELFRLKKIFRTTHGLKTILCSRWWKKWKTPYFIR